MSDLLVKKEHIAELLRRIRISEGSLALVNKQMLVIHTVLTTMLENVTITPIRGEEDLPFEDDLPPLDCYDEVS